MRRPVTTGAIAAYEHSSERAQAVRSVAELLSTEAPLTELWLRCCATLAQLAGCDRVTVAARERDRDEIAFAYAGGVGSRPADPTVKRGSLCAEVLALGESIVRDERDGRAVGVPIRFGRTIFGAIALERTGSSDEETVTLLESCALQLGSRLYYESTIARSERFAMLAFTDGLTGVSNRRQFDDVLDREWGRAAREEQSLALLMIDLDYFKSYNDAFGHQGGDLCLQRVAHALHECVRRPADVLARYGGEEFVALLPAIDLPGAAAIGEEMRAAVAALDIRHPGTSLGRVSLSVGAAVATPSHGVPSAALLQSADDALYRAKMGGRNRVYASGYAPPGEAVRPRRLDRDASTNLPMQLTRLVGRKAECEHIRELLAGHRLVSVVGTGGTGKTRCAIAVATREAERFADGAWFVDLSPIADPTLIATTIAAVFGAEVSMDESGIDALAVILESKDALVVIDNCEHLVAEVANVAVGLLRRCPKLSVLATSREALSIPGESIYRLPLLSMPARTDEPTASQAMDFDAVALFVERATAAKRDFELTDDNVADVLEICRAVDGIALAIELAASRVGIIGLRQVAERLSEFRLLTGSDRTALPRQRTMHAMIGWSFDLLSEEERALFRRLAVFSGNFTFDAVTEICSGLPVNPEDVFDLLSGLIRKSLVVEDPGRESRYRLLDSVRAFAREKLLDAGEAERLAKWHADYFEALARDADSGYRYAPSRSWLDALEPDVDNFRSAMEWALDRRGDVALGAALAAATINFFNDYMPSEGTRWMQKALELLPRGSAPRIEAHLCVGLSGARNSIPPATIRAAAERAVELSRQIGDRLGLAEALRGCAAIIGWYFRADRPLADALACEAIELARQAGDPVQLALALRTRGLTIDISDFPAKRAVLEEALALMRAHGNDRFIASTLTWIGDLECSAGEYERAIEYGREAMRYAESSGSNEMYVTAANNLANYACILGDWTTARAAALEAMRVARKTRHYEGLTFGIQALAAIAALDKRAYEPAAQLLGFVDSRCGVLHAGRQADQSEDRLYQRVVARLGEHVDAGKLAQLTSAGSSLNEEEAVALALAASG